MDVAEKVDEKSLFVPPPYEIKDPVYDVPEEKNNSGVKLLLTFVALVVAIFVGWVLSQQ